MTPNQHYFKGQKRKGRKFKGRQHLAILRFVLLFILLASAVAYGIITSAVALHTMRQHESSLGHGDSLNHQATDNRPKIPPLGITVQLEDASFEERQAALNRLKKSGFGWIRQRLDWAEIEPSQGKFNWQVSDAIINAISDQRLIPVILLDGSPAWARGPDDADNPLAPPADPHTFATFAQAVAQRYADTIQFYQIWDEPNIAPHWGSRWVEPIEYARLLAVGGCAIRNADPDATIISAALAPTTDRGHAAIYEALFIQRLIAAMPPAAMPPVAMPSADPLCPTSTGSAPLFDILAIQPYGFGHHPADSRQQRDILNFQRAAHIHRTMVAADQADTPIWAIRFGWNRTQNSPWASVPAERQPEFAAAAIQHARAHWPWLHTVGWHIDQPAAPTADPVWGFALTEQLADQMREAVQMPAPAEDAHATRLLDLWTVPLLMLLLIAGLAWRVPATVSLLSWRHQLVRVLDNASIRGPLWIALLYTYHIATWPPLMLILFMLGTALLFHTPRDGLLFAALLLPFHFRQKEIWLFAYPWAIAPAQAMLLCLLPALLHQITRTKKGTLVRNRTSTLLDLLALLWLIINLISFTNVWHKPAYIQGFIDLAAVPLLLYLAARFLIRTPAHWRQLLFALWIGGILVAIVGWFNWLGGSGPSADGIRRLVGPHYSPNHTALYLERTIFVGIGLLFYYNPSLTFSRLIKKLLQARKESLSRLTRHRFLTFLLSLFLGFLLITIIFTASRGALLLGLPVGIAIFYLQIHTKHQSSPRFTTIRSGWPKFARSTASTRARLLIGLSLLLSLLISLTLASLALFIYWDRLSNSTTLWRRTQIWQATLDLWRDHFWTGVGPGGFFWRYPAYILDQPLLDPNIAHPHNVWLEFGAQWGLFGFIWLLGIIGTIIFNMRRKGKEKSAPNAWLIAGIYAGLAASIAHAQVDSFASMADLAGWNWLAIALYATSAAGRPQPRPDRSCP